MINLTLKSYFKVDDVSDRKIGAFHFYKYICTEPSVRKPNSHLIFVPIEKNPHNPVSLFISEAKIG